MPLLLTISCQPVLSSRHYICPAAAAYVRLAAYVVPVGVCACKRATCSGKHNSQSVMRAWPARLCTLQLECLHAPLVPGIFGFPAWFGAEVLHYGEVATAH